jgi:hypothetical protein
MLCFIFRIVVRKETAIIGVFENRIHNDPVILIANRSLSKIARFFETSSLNVPDPIALIGDSAQTNPMRSDYVIAGINNTQFWVLFDRATFKVPATYEIASNKTFSFSNNL